MHFLTLIVYLTQFDVMAFRSPAVGRGRLWNDSRNSQDIPCRFGHIGSDSQPKLGSREAQANFLHSRFDLWSVGTDNFHMFAVSGISLVTGHHSVKTASSQTHDLKA
jgi:hypothetical protein